MGGYACRQDQGRHSANAARCSNITAKRFRTNEATPVKYSVVLEESDEGFSVSVPGLPGCHSQGATEAEALENISAAIVDYLAVVADLTRGKAVREIEIAA